VTPPEPTPATPKVEQAQVDALKAEVLALRKQAFDLGVPEVLADDWTKADDSWSAAAAVYDSKNWPGALEAYATSKTLFADILPRGLVALAERARGHAEEWKKVAAEAGAELSSAERFAAADSALAAAQADRDAENNEAAIAGFNRSRALFELSEKHLRALALEGEIETKGYAPWDRGNADKALSLIADENVLFADDGGKTLEAASKGIDILSEVILRYNLVVQKGGEGLATEARGRGDELRQKSLEIKADVAVKAEYATASERYDGAASEYQAGKFDDARAAFDEATELFQTAFTLASEKRAAALEAMKAADETHASSLESATKADSDLALEATTPADGSH
jgi:hypothetical protein